MCRCGCSVVAVGRDSSVLWRQTGVQVRQVLTSLGAVRFVVCARVHRPGSVYRHLSPDAQSPVDVRQRPPPRRRRLARRRGLRHPTAGHLRLRRAGAGRIRRLRLLGELRAGVDAAAVHHLVRGGRLRRPAAVPRRHLHPHLFRRLAQRRLRAAAALHHRGPSDDRRRRQPVHVERQATTLGGSFLEHSPDEGRLGERPRHHQHSPAGHGGDFRAQYVQGQDENGQTNADGCRQLRNLLGSVHRSTAVVRLGSSRAIRR